MHACMAETGRGVGAVRIRVEGRGACPCLNTRDLFAVRPTYKPGSQEELEAYDKHQRLLEDQLDAKTAELIGEARGLEGRDQALQAWSRAGWRGA